MERHAALAMLSRIEAWTSPDRPFRQPVADAWLEMLCELDEGTAGTAWARVKRGDEPVSPRMFERVYRTLHTTDADTRTECEACSGSGWTPAGFYTHRGVTYSAARPCNCRDGNRAATSATWRDAQARTLTREPALPPISPAEPRTAPTGTQGADKP